MKVLGIESSCDETSASVVYDSMMPEGRILSNIVYSQTAIHSEYGGVVPEYAARNHMGSIEECILTALEKANTNLKDIDTIAVTSGPGLIGGLLVGTVTAKTIAIMADKPFMAINHLEGHLLTSRLCHNVRFPNLSVLASGGHFMFVEVLEVGQYRILGETLDDATGECLDKVAKMLGLGYPGGAAIEALATVGDSNRFSFPTPLRKRSGCDVSFSGLKTAAKNIIQNCTDQDKADIAASFQSAVFNFIVQQTNKALSMCKTKPTSIVLAGGVAANKLLRSKMKEITYDYGIEFYAPPINLCSDNAAMIAWACIERTKAGYSHSSITHITKPRWNICE